MACLSYRLFFYFKAICEIENQLIATILTKNNKSLFSGISTATLLFCSLFFYLKKTRRKQYNKSQGENVKFESHIFTQFLHMLAIHEFNEPKYLAILIQSSQQNIGNFEACRRKQFFF